ncbi:hypothetical protein BJX64DRAFT_253344, partial [Aspergillus heterothallicus]
MTAACRHFGPPFPRDRQASDTPLCSAVATWIDFMLLKRASCPLPAGLSFDFPLL